MRWTPLVALATTFIAGGSLGADVRPWKPVGISSPLFESHAAFDPKTGDLYFVRSSPAFEGWRIFVSSCTAKGWSEPRPPAFAGDGVEADPWFTPDGRSLYFISTRSRSDPKRKDLDIWRVGRGADGVWAAPVRLPEPVNSAGTERGRTGAGWSPRVKLGPNVNVNGTEIGAVFSPSGRSLLFSRDLKGSESGEFFVWHEAGAEAWPPECPRANR
jgi:hypothetical protein